MEALWEWGEGEREGKAHAERGEKTEERERDGQRGKGLEEPKGLDYIVKALREREAPTSQVEGRSFSHTLQQVGT